MVGNEAAQYGMNHNYKIEISIISVKTMGYNLNQVYNVSQLYNKLYNS